MVLLHGLWRSFRSMEPMARHLHNLGFSTLNIPYPSSRLPLAGLLDHLRAALSTLPPDREVHFVTHSLGGILVRALLAERTSSLPGRIVMLAPPQQGSEIVDWASAVPGLVRTLLGPVGMELASHAAPSTLPHPKPPVETAVIMGNRSTLPFFRGLLEPENDGIVSASKGRFPGLQNFAVVPADHTFIQIHPETLDLTANFLLSGTWPSLSA